MANLITLSTALMTLGWVGGVVPKISFRLSVISSSRLVSPTLQMCASSWTVFPFPNALRSWVPEVLPDCGCGRLGFPLVPVKPKWLGEPGASSPAFPSPSGSACVVSPRVEHLHLDLVPGAVSCAEEPAVLCVKF